MFYIFTKNITEKFLNFSIKFNEFNNIQLSSYKIHKIITLIYGEEDNINIEESL